MKTVKIIEGKAFLCEEIKSSDVPFEYTTLTWCVEDCITSVKNRMAHCMEALEASVQNNMVYKIEKDLIHHAGGIFVIPSYEAMKSLLNKLEDEFKHDKLIDIVWMQIKLSTLEVDQLFKAYVAYSDKFDVKEMTLLDTVIAKRQSNR